MLKKVIALAIATAFGAAAYAQTPAAKPADTLKPAVATPAASAPAAPVVKAEEKKNEAAPNAAAAADTKHHHRRHKQADSEHDKAAEHPAEKPVETKK